MIYRLHAEKDDNDTWLVTSPDFPEVTTFAEKEEDIARYGLAAIEEAIAARVADGQPIPPPMKGRLARQHGPIVRLPLLVSLKVELFQALKDSKHIKTRADLARHLKWHRNQVDRLFDFDHESKTDQIEQAFQALDREIDVRVRELA